METDSLIGNNMSTVYKKTANKYSVRDKRKYPFVISFMILPVFQIAIFYFYVNFYSFSLAFTNLDGTYGFGSFKQVFDAFATGTDRIGFNPLDMFNKPIKY